MAFRDYLKLFCAVALSQAAGLVGTLFTVSAIPMWYAGLVKPELSPPNWIFAPVWTTLYTLMGIALYLVWKKLPERGAVSALWLFGLQLALNAVWSPIFFGLQNTGLALIVIVLMWVAIVLTIVTFAKVSRTAAWLLVPYVLWVSFATYLNYSIWILN